MKKFVRQKAPATPDVELDFGAATAKIAHVFDPDGYRLRLEAARVVRSNQNVSVVLDLVELESGSRVAIMPLWVDGPNAAAGNLAAENQHTIAQLLTLAKLPTAGNVGELIPKLAGLEFAGRLVLTVDGRSGRTYNALADVYTDGVS